jgi:hypothetical protein
MKKNKVNVLFMASLSVLSFLNFWGEVHADFDADGAITCQMTNDKKEAAKKAVGESDFAGLYSLSCSLNAPMYESDFDTGNGSSGLVEVLRGYRKKDGIFSMAFMSAIEKDYNTGEYRVIASGASSMFYDAKTGEVRQPESKSCDTPFFRNVQDAALTALSHLTGTDIVAEDIPVCDLGMSQAGLQIAIFRGFRHFSSPTAVSALYSLIWFDPKSGQVLEHDDSASGI